MVFAVRIFGDSSAVSEQRTETVPEETPIIRPSTMMNAHHNMPGPRQESENRFYWRNMGSTNQAGFSMLRVLPKNHPFRANELPLLTLVELCEAIQSALHLKDICIAGNFVRGLEQRAWDQLSVADWKKICEAFGSLNSIRCVRLDAGEISKDQELGLLLDHFPAVTSLSIEGGYGYSRTFNRSLERIEHLHLDGCRLTSEECGSLAHALEHTPNLGSLRIRHTHFTSYNDWAGIMEILLNSNSLVDVHLSDLTAEDQQQDFAPNDEGYVDLCLRLKRARQGYVDSYPNQGNLVLLDCTMDILRGWWRVR